MFAQGASCFPTARAGCCCRTIARTASEHLQQGCSPKEQAASCSLQFCEQASPIRRDKGVRTRSKLLVGTSFPQGCSPEEQAASCSLQFCEQASPIRRDKGVRTRSKLLVGTSFPQGCSPKEQAASCSLQFCEQASPIRRDKGIPGRASWVLPYPKLRFLGHPRHDGPKEAGSCESMPILA